MLEAGSRLAHGQRWGFQSKRENENLVVCYSRDMVFELQDYQKSQKPTCDLMLSKPRKRPSGVFFQSQNSGESVPCREVDKSSKMASRILTEYYWRIQYIRPLGLGTILDLRLSTSLDLHCHLFPQGMISGGAYNGIYFFVYR